MWGPRPLASEGPEMLDNMHVPVPPSDLGWPKHLQFSSATLAWTLRPCSLQAFVSLAGCGGGPGSYKE